MASPMAVWNSPERSRKRVERSFMSVMREGRADPVPALGDPLRQRGLDEAVQVAVEHAPDVSDLDAGAVVLHERVRMEDVAPDLVPPGRRLVLTAQLRLLFLLLLELQLKEARAEDAHGDLAIA